MIGFVLLLFRSPRPLVNVTLIAISAMVFIYMLFLGGLDRQVFLYRYGLIPVELSQGIEFTTLGGGPLARDISSPIPTWGTAVTSMFIHGGILHFVGNMLFLWGFGDKVEYKLGHFKYLVFYLGAGIAAVWTQVATDLDSRTILIGASGAISGVVGAYLLAYPYKNIIALIFVFFILPLFFGIGSFGADVLAASGIAYMAHIGGFIAGVLLMAGYKFILKEPIWPYPRRWPRGY